MFEYFAVLRVAASSAAEPASRAAAATYESANGQMTVTSQVSGFPAFHGDQRKTIRPFPIGSAKTKWLFGAWNASRNQSQGDQIIQGVVPGRSIIIVIITILTLTIQRNFLQCNSCFAQFCMFHAHVGFTTCKHSSLASVHLR